MCSVLPPFGARITKSGCAIFGATSVRLGGGAVLEKSALPAESMTACGAFSTFCRPWNSSNCSEYMRVPAPSETTAASWLLSPAASNINLPPAGPRGDGGLADRKLFATPPPGGEAARRQGRGWPIGLCERGRDAGGAACAAPPAEGWSSDGRSRGGLGCRLVLEAGEPSERPRQVPVAIAEELHRRGQEHRADQRRVDQDGGGQADAHLLHVDHRQDGEHEEGADHDGGSARDDACARLDPMCDRFLVRESAVIGLADAAQDEDVVVHREPEEDHE